MLAKGIRASEAQTTALDGANKQLLRGVGADMASQMAGSGEGLVAVRDGADVFPCPLGRLLGLEVILVGGVVVRRGREEIGIAVFAGRGVGLHVAGELVGSGEALVAVGEVAGVRLFAGVGADVAGLVLEAQEGFVAEMALVRARSLL